MPMPGFSPVGAALGLGDELQQQVEGETEEQRRRRMAQIAAQTRSLPRPEITPDDPIHGLFDGYKQAEASYRTAIADMARRHGLPVQNMAKIVQGARKQRRRPAARYLTSAEVAAKYKAMSPEEKAIFSREFERIMGEPHPA